MPDGAAVRLFDVGITVFSAHLSVPLRERPFQQAGPAAASCCFN